MRPINRLRRFAGFIVAALAATIMLGGTADAANPRWVTGWPYFGNNDGLPVVWYTTSPLYYTDPGDLSATVSHATADALVASAAGAWNNSMASLVLAQGGALNEHVSSANVYLGSSGPVFPSDVQATNYLAKPIAVIYDTDGSVTDTLLGGGASDPGNCRQSAVTESVDSIATNGQIQHALIVLNGRCINATTVTQQEMKYRLVRAFGRVLGLGWSQLNDNVFTGVPQATSQQAQNWPLMHPIDLYCGPYAYQCMVNPFTPRTDDLGALISMYPVSTSGNGKTASYTNATKVGGFVNFANGQGMEGQLISLRRFHFGPGYSDAYDLTSSVTGMSFQQVGGNPITPKTGALLSSLGSTNSYYEGYYFMGWVPVPTTDYFDNFTVTTSAINPLYTGQYAVGPYPVSQVTPSGPPMTSTAYVVNTTYGARLDMTADGSSTQTTAAAPGTCGGTGDGTVYAPLAVAGTGFWSDALCGFEHTAWSSLAVKAGRSLTMEVTAVDEQGYATTGKMLPVLGAWDSNDAAGAVPSIASQAAGLNASTLGMTNMVAATTTARTMRLAIADQRGDGRPDYGYNARVLYADTVSPASLPANGGVVTIAGMGFKPGNTVTVNGVAANVTGWTSTAITLVAPAITGPLAADVVVTDLSTGGQTRMTGALAYSQTSQPDVLSVVSKPADGGYVGSVGSPVFKVQVTLPDGVTPASGVGVTVSSARATFGACSNASTCVLTTDSSGFVSSAVTPTTAGTVGLTAAVGASSVSVTFVAQAIPVDQLSVLSLPSGTVYATLPAAAPFKAQVTLPDGTTAAAGVAVVVTATNATLGGCSGLATCTMIADALGRIATAVTPLAAGVVSLLATAGGGMVSASFGATALPADGLHLVSKPADGSYVGRVAAVRFGLQVMLGDDATPASGVSVTVTAAGGTLGACGGSTCVLAADATGNVSTTVTPTAAGTVTLSASAGGGALTANFNAVVVPPDVLTVVTKPANGSYVARVAAVPFAVQVALGDTGAVASGVAVTVSAVGATLGACSASPCVLTADAAGTISTTVVPTAAGTVSLTATAGGGTVTASFVAVAIPPDTLRVATKPANGAYVGRVAAFPFAVQVMDGETGVLAAGVAVTVTATGATLAACSGATCVLTADAMGGVTTTVTPTSAGTVTLTASAGGGTVSASFTAVVVPPDSLHVATKPADGAYVGRVAMVPFAVQVALGDGSGPAAGVSVVVSATNGTLVACGASTCTLTADASGSVSTSVTPLAAGAVGLTAAAGGGTVSASFNAIAVPPDVVRVVTKPADGAYAARTATTPFAISVALGDTGLPAAGVAVTVSATNATLSCGGSSCGLSADAAGAISVAVTPTAAGVVTLTASAGGGTVSASFNAVPVPSDALHVVTQPANGSYAGAPAGVAFTVQALLGDTGGPANGATVSVSAANATLGCGASTCTLIASVAGTVTTSVTPTTAGTVTLTASAGGGSVSTTFSAVNMPPDTLRVVTSPADNTYTGNPAALPFSVSVLLGDGVTPAAGVSVVVTATGATLGVCGLSTCTLTASALGVISSAVTATAAGMVTLTASAGGGTVSATFVAINAPHLLQVVSVPSDSSYINRVAATPFAVQVTLGAAANVSARGLHALVATRPPAVGEPVTMTAVGGTLGACGLPTCVVTTDSTGTASSTVTPILPGPVTLLALSGGGTTSSSFVAATPPDVVGVRSTPANGSYVNRTASTAFAVLVMLGDGTTPAAGVSVTLTATGATLNVCGSATCVVGADASGVASSMVTPTSAGMVMLTASAGGGTATASFSAVAVPSDVLHVVSQPANGSYAGRVGGLPFGVQVLLGDTGGAAAGAAVTVSATNATLGACGLATCMLTADASGNVSTTVTPTAAGSVALSASAGGGTVSTAFTAANVPPDTLHAVSQPANGSYVQRAATQPFTVQVLLGDTGGAASGAMVNVSAVNATLGACGLSTCVVTADSTGTITTTVTPSAPGSVTMTASSGGGSTTASFTAAAVPPDSLRVVAQPANGAYAQRAAATPFTVQTLLGDTGAAAAGASVTLTATNATLAACGGATCVLIADGSGSVSSAVTPVAPGVVTLGASAGGGTVTASFTATAVPADAVHVLSQPANGSYANRSASAPFTVQVLLGDTNAAAAGVSVTLTATGATLSACGASTCIVAADGSGTVSTTVTPSVTGAVQLTAAAGGGTATVTFTSAAVPPDALQVVSQPSDGAYVSVVATSRFTVQILLGDTGAPAAGASVTVSASNAILDTCGQATCVITADASGRISTPVTPIVVGPISITASAGGGSVTVAFNAAAVPADVLRVTSQPTGAVYAGLAAGAPFTVQVLMPDGTSVAAGASVVISANNAALGSCAGNASCVLTANASGVVSTSVTPQQAGAGSLHASSGGGSVTATFVAITLPADVLSVTSVPSSPSYVGAVAATRFAVHVLLGDGVTPAAGAAVTLTATGADLGACGSSPCTLIADASGNIWTPVTPLTSGTVMLTALAGGGSTSASFTVSPDVVRVVTSPANGTFTGSPGANQFAVQVLLGDGSTAATGISVTLTASNASLGACAGTPCTLTTDAQGMISTPVTASAAGAVTLSASAAGGSASATFTASAPPDILEVQSTPANGSYVGRSAVIPFTVGVALGNATNRLLGALSAVLPPAAGAVVSLTATGATLDACGAGSCALTADASGMVATTVTPTGVGAVSLAASAGGGTVSASFTAAAAPNVLRIASLPANGSFTGRSAAAPFTVQVLAADGVTATPGTLVTLTASGATFGVCGLASCTLIVPASGFVTTPVTPRAVGTITLSAMGGNGTVSASFSAATPPDTLSVTSVPANGSYTGRAATQPFSIRVLLGDGVTPASGASVTFSAANATLGACAQVSCALTADAAGLVSTTVTPSNAGPVTLTATAGGGTASASFGAVAPVRTISVSRPVEYVAAGATVIWAPSVTVFENGLPIAGVSVSWTGALGLSVSGASSTTDRTGTATMGVTVGPLAVGTVSGQACAWTSACAAFGAQTIDSSLWLLQAVSGDSQTVGAGDTLQPVVVRAVDAAGDPVAGVAITIHQTVRGWVVCPPSGRCPTGPILNTASSMVVSDADGLATVAPLQVAGATEITQIVAAAGSNGYVAVSLSKTP